MDFFNGKLIYMGQDFRREVYYTLFMTVYLQDLFYRFKQSATK